MTTTTFGATLRGYRERARLTQDSVAPTRLHDRGEAWFAPDEPPTVADWKARLLERARREPSDG